MRQRFANPVGATLAAALLVAAPLVAMWGSGHWELFSQDRGLLQLVVVIPLSSLITAVSLALLRLVTPVAMLWAMVPVGALIMLGVGVAGPGFRAWPWAVALGVALFVPWLVGVALCARLRGHPMSERSP